MKLITLKPLYLGGKTVVEGRSFETHEQHGRELIAKGYAALDESDAEPVVTLAEEPVVSSMSLTGEQLMLTPPGAAVGDEDLAPGKAATAKKKKAT
ncbi:hypothetical protein [Pseudomonas sp. BF-R-01]|uniref:DUF7210 family protein n=1 Tax=Pseudomonas sp. BF-R-01 TaxID=2832365 RepID=UPI001CBFA8E1|nr:hypothetical protein [Pseudomonas sp. BF-R-01]